MQFNSVEFLRFFPAVCLIYFIIPQRLKNIWLLVSSYYFYMCWNPKYAPLIFTSTLITYLSGIGIEHFSYDNGENKKAKNIVVALSFSTNLAILFFFKYYNFFSDNLNRLLGYFDIQIIVPEIDVLLPVGISFYTFQALSYTMDVYRKEIKAEKSFVNYALFVSFFPQLVAGPIERSKNLLKQIKVVHSFDFENFRSGLLQMMYGFFQKIVISEACAIFVVQVYDNYRSYSGMMIAVATVLFAFQIYCDFGGYSNIARGAAKVMGFSLMENFHEPYFADSTSDFWRRWHISLSTWFRDYLYFPLGGNRKGKARKYFNIMVVFLVSGLWHGANWTFVVWGGLNGLYQVLGDIIKPFKNRAMSFFRVKQNALSYRLYSIFLTFLFIDFAWLFFRADSMSQAMDMIRFGITNIGIWDLFDGMFTQCGLSQAQLAVLIIALFILFTVDVMKENSIDVIGWVQSQGIVLRWIIYFGLLYYTLIFGIYGPKYDASQFIYFQF